MFNGFNISTISDCYFGNTHVSEIYYGLIKLWPLHDYRQDYLTFESLEAGNVFKLYSTDETVSAKTIQYSTNKLDWTNVTASDAGTTIITLNAGQKVYLRGDNPHGMNYWKSGIGHKPCYFGASKKFNISGCIMSLSFMDNTASYNDTGDGGAMNMLFHDSPVVDASNLILNQVYATNNACSNMFENCTQLTCAPALPATTLRNYCYSAMFKGCTSLVTAPVLPATTLANYCYNNMFNGCTSLTAAPVLPATTLASSCYKQMFQNCSKVNYIKCLATDISATDCTTNWVTNVAATGTFVKDASMNSWTIGNNGIPTGWVSEHDYSRDYLTFTAVQSGTFKFTRNALQYSVDNGSTWHNLPKNTPSPTVSAGSKIMWKQTGLTPGTIPGPWGIGTFSSTGNFNVHGNVMSLYYGDNFYGQTSLSGKSYAFYELFHNCTKLINAENLILPATTLSSMCYALMFRSCTNLTAIPKLPSTNIASGCYMEMFQNCTSLTTVPELPASYLYSSCYSGMFKGCTSLTTVPNNLLPATRLANTCYSHMFYGCTSLTRAPELPALNLYQNCYYAMFHGCTSLRYIKCLATNISATACTTGWVESVASTGTFVKNSIMSSWPRNNDGIPQTWAVGNA